MAWVEARCPLHLWFKLDPERGVVEVRCARCDAFHYFDAATGELVDSGPCSTTTDQGQPHSTAST